MGKAIPVSQFVLYAVEQAVFALGAYICAELDILDTGQNHGTVFVFTYVKLCRSSNNKIQILCDLRGMLVWAIVEPVVCHKSKWSFSNLQLGSVASWYPPICKEQCHSFSSIGTAGKKSLLFFWACSPSLGHEEELWALKFFFNFSFLLRGWGWTGGDRERLVLYVPFLFHFPGFSQPSRQSDL